MAQIRAAAILVILLAIGGAVRDALRSTPAATAPAPLDGRPIPGQPASATLLFGGRLDLNRATLEDLSALPGIGPERARRILRRRQLVGPYRALEDLAEITGIGPRTLERLRPLVALTAGGN